MKAYRPGLRFRLVLAATLTTAFAVGAIAYGVQLLLDRSAETESVNLLRARTDAAAATVRITDGRPMVLETPSDSLDQNVWVFGATGRPVDGTVPPGLQSQVDQLKEVGVARTVVAGRTRLFARPVVIEGRRVAVVIAGLDLTPYERSERRSLWVTTGLGGLIVVAAGLGAWAAARHSLRQVHRMVRRADDWQEHDLSGRFDLGPPVDELTELGGTLDRMLDRIASALEAERRLTDEVAHELRTPLAVIRSEAQLALADPAAGTEGSLLAIVAASNRMEMAIRTMLELARSGLDEAAGCDAAGVLSALAGQARSPAHPSVRIEVREPFPPLGIAAPQAVVLAALWPLLDNAVRHAAHRVRLSARRDRQDVVLVVEDDGIGVPAEAVETIFQIGHTGSGHQGTGLGLALARRLAGSVGGQVRAVAAGHGCFEVVLRCDDAISRTISRGPVRVR